MRSKWGSYLLPVLAAFLLLSGCTTTSSTVRTQDMVSKTVVQTLPADLGLLADQVLIDLPLGDVVYKAASDQAAVAVLSIPVEQQSVMGDITVSWEIADRIAQPIVTLPPGLSRDGVRLDLELSYPPDKLPRKTVIRLGKGQILLSGFQGELDAQVTEGSCTLERAILEDESQVVAGGTIRADLAQVRPGVQQLEAGFGMLEVRLPADAGAHIIAQAQMGEIYSELNFSYLDPVSETGVGSELSGWLNAGGSELRLLIKSGNISLYPW